MRRFYKKQYHKPARKRTAQQPYQTIEQPAWDDTIHDLSKFRLSPEEQLRRRLSRISTNQLGVAVVSKGQSLKGAGNGSARYSPSISSEEDRADSKGECGSTTGKQHLPLSRSVHLQLYDKQAERCDDESEDDVCRWQGIECSPFRAPESLHEAVGEAAEITNGQQYSQQQPATTIQDLQKQPEKVAERHIAVPTTTLQVLFDKIDWLEQQLHTKLEQQHQHPGQQQDTQLKQQLASSQQQLLSTQQQLVKLQEEHKQYVSHTSSLLIRLQGQLQQLMSQEVVGQLPAVIGADTDGVAEQGPGSLSAASRQSVGAAATALDTHPLADSKPQLTILKQLRAACNSCDAISYSQSTTKESTTVAAEVAVTASPQKLTSSHGRQCRPAVDDFHYAGPVATADAAADIAVLPSYAEMKQRASIDRAQRVSGNLAGQAVAAATPAPDSQSSAPASGSAVQEHVAAASSQRAQLLQMLLPSPMLCSKPSSDAVSQPTSRTREPDISNNHLNSPEHQQQEEGERLGGERLYGQVPGNWSNAAQAAPSIAAYDQDASMILLNPALRVDADLPDIRDTDWGLHPGLSRAAVSRVYTAAGMAEKVELLGPRVFLDQLKRNVSLTDHLRAAKSAGVGSSGAALTKL